MVNRDSRGECKHKISSKYIMMIMSVMLLWAEMIDIIVACKSVDATASSSSSKIQKRQMPLDGHDGIFGLSTSPTRMEQMTESIYASSSQINDSNSGGFFPWDLNWFKTELCPAGDLLNHVSTSFSFTVVASVLIVYSFLLSICCGKCHAPETCLGRCCVKSLCCCCCCCYLNSKRGHVELSDSDANRSTPKLRCIVDFVTAAILLVACVTTVIAYVDRHGVSAMFVITSLVAFFLSFVATILVFSTAWRSFCFVAGSDKRSEFLDEDSECGDVDLSQEHTEASGGVVRIPILPQGRGMDASGIAAAGATGRTGNGHDE